ncbi:hypothetical protein GCM10022287_22400 [Gryllotalpicola koreensis]|uniref:Transcriptional regulator WhiB n=1 Tax=Gryllotalpicola koreensis TaxID=993086 RepID=A0ABP8A223_9MICO
MPDDPESWRKEASCRDIDDPDVFFSPHGSDQARAAALCADCPVRAQCLTYALDTDTQDGFWGGKTEAQRARMPRVRQVKHCKSRLHSLESDADYIYFSNGERRCKACHLATLERLKAARTA